MHARKNETPDAGRGLPAAVGAAVGVVVLAVVLVLGATPAGAHQPLFVDEGSPVPVIADGNVSFAAYGRIEEPGGEVGVDVRHVAGDTVRVELLVPDRPPESDRPTHDALTVEVRSPSGEVTTLPAGEVLGRFDEPFTSTSYLRLVEWSAPAEAGTYEVRVRADVPSRVVLVTGVLEQPGQVEGYTGPGVEALASWYDTPVGTERGAALDEAPSAGAEGDGSGGDAAVGEDGSAEAAGEGTPPATRGVSPDTGAGQSRDVIGRSAGWPVLVAVLGLMALVSVVALRPWRRRPRG